jgi:hypothetical protein
MQAAPQPDRSGYETLENFSQATAVNRWMYERIRKYLNGEFWKSVAESKYFRSYSRLSTVPSAIFAHLI